MTIATMIDYIYLAAVFCGCIAAFEWQTGTVRNRTVFLLVLSAGIAALLPLIGIEYDPLLWAAIDLGVVIIPLLGPKHTASDALIVAIFAGIWPTYLSDDMTAISIGTSLVIVQFMLALGVPALILKILQRCRIPINRNGPLEMLAS